MKFDKVFKLYVFKEQDRANLSLYANDSLVIEYRLTIKELQHIVDNWRTGVDFTTDYNCWCIEYKLHGPRPERKYSPYVRLSVNHTDCKFHYRLTYDDMLELERDFSYQLNNDMYWEENV